MSIKTLEYTETKNDVLSYIDEAKKVLRKKIILICAIGLPLALLAFIIFFLAKEKEAGITAIGCVAFSLLLVAMMIKVYAQKREALLNRFFKCCKDEETEAKWVIEDDGDKLTILAVATEEKNIIKKEDISWVSCKEKSIHLMIRPRYEMALPRTTDIETFLKNAEIIKN